ncbi:TonB-dependent receptor plug domain-containing protein [Aeoliella mucimassa]|uniref:Colicin I receptor n=1 Tax=Aeoliella mucimassa TaxID=2527972 RepID=A0A518AV79_9BACT|nr:TonB-dependent receptor [Aeoliella mucimassa]QDU58621.1 Colicin I receptor precursor [Aeoliella mucimassa]
MQFPQGVWACLTATLFVAPVCAQQLSVGPDPTLPESISLEQSLDQPSLDDVEDEDLLDMDLEQLTRADVMVAGEMDTEVSIATRTAQPISQTAAAVFVITNEMITRSGARNIPEALRLAPGVHVARSNSHTWAISIRGFSTQYANKLLVQIDGRAIYTPIFGGTFWDQQLVPMHDIERIEVIRGPGSSVWGANATNGVINIVTKHSRDTRGGYAEAGGGNEHRHFGHLRWGGGDSELTYRVYAMESEDDFGYRADQPPSDGRDGATVGFRADWKPTCQDEFTFTGNLLKGNSNFGAPYVGIESENILARWNHQVDQDTDWQIQLYYDQFDREDDFPPFYVNSQSAHRAFDLDTLFHTRWRQRHDIVCGFGFRDYHTGITGTGLGDFLAPQRDQFDIISYFLQDTYTVAEDYLYLTLGSKMEHTDFVGFTYQPTVKLALTPDERTSLWASAARAVRTPSQSDRDLNYYLPQPSPPDVLGVGSRSVMAESAMVYELGIRRQESDSFYWDLTAYYSDYDDVISFVPQSQTPSLITVQYDNAYSGAVYGAELLAMLEVNECWRLRGFYTWMQTTGDLGPTGIDSFGVPLDMFVHNTASITSSHDLTSKLKFDGTLRYVDSVRGGVSHYIVADVRLAYRPCKHWEYSVVGQNLFDDKHLESTQDLYESTEVQTGVFGMVSCEF